MYQKSLLFKSLPIIFLKFLKFRQIFLQRFPYFNKLNKILFSPSLRVSFGHFKFCFPVKSLTNRFLVFFMLGFLNYLYFCLRLHLVFQGFSFIFFHFLRYFIIFVFQTSLCQFRELF